MRLTGRFPFKYQKKNTHIRNLQIALRKDSEKQDIESEGYRHVDAPAACSLKPAPDVSPPRPSGSDTHTRGGRWRSPLPAETPATSGQPRCLDSVRERQWRQPEKHSIRTAQSTRWPESTVYLSASCATMLTSPSSREANAEPKSRRKRDSHTRQYCSPHSPRLHHGAWKEPGTQQVSRTVKASRPHSKGSSRWRVFLKAFVHGRWKSLRAWPRESDTVLWKSQFLCIMLHHFTGTL